MPVPKIDALPLGDTNIGIGPTSGKAAIHKAAGLRVNAGKERKKEGEIPHVAPIDPDLRYHAFGLPTLLTKMRSNGKLIWKA
uniref:Uncharacterized protein n=1 Tax=Cucumis melo TaxID=3656 RepID=A0A9I9DZ00_CUCME